MKEEVERGNVQERYPDSKQITPNRSKLRLKEGYREAVGRSVAPSKTGMAYSRARQRGTLRHHSIFNIIQRGRPWTGRYSFRVRVGGGLRRTLFDGYLSFDGNLQSLRLKSANLEKQTATRKSRTNT